jgi:hypothetical protein
VITADRAVDTSDARFIVDVMLHPLNAISLDERIESARRKIAERRIQLSVSHDSRTAEKIARAEWLSGYNNSQLRQMALLTKSLHDSPVSLHGHMTRWANNYLSQSNPL